MEQQPTSDERFMGSMCYWGSLLINMVSGGFGFIVPIIIFLVKKNESPFVKREALKAIIATVIIFGLAVLSVLVGVFFTFATFGLGALIFIPVVLLGYIAILIYKIYLACEVYKGNNPHIPLVSNLAERWL